jgi:hypothetical protein
VLLDLLQKRKKAKGPTQLSKFFKGADASDSSDSGKGLAPTLTLAPFRNSAACPVTRANKRNALGARSTRTGPRSAISGKRIKLKLNRNKEEKEMDKKRKEVLEFYNQMY